MNEPGASLTAELQDLYDTGRFVTAWGRLSTFDPPEAWQDPAARILAGRLMRFLGAEARGERLLLRSWRRRPQDPAAFHHALWIVSGRRGAWEALVRLRRQPVPESAPVQHRSEALCLEGDLLSRLRDFTRAEPLLARARELAPADPWPLVCRAFHLERRDAYPEALGAAHAALALNPRYPHAISFAAHLHQLLGEDDAAVTLLEEGCRATENSRAAVQLAMLLHELGRLDDVERILGLHACLTPLAEASLVEWASGLRAHVAYRRGDLDAAAQFAGKAGTHPFHQGFKDRLERRDPAWRRVELPVGFVRQHHLTCVPATLTTLSRYWNRPADHLEVTEAICYDGTPSHAERNWCERNGWVAREFRVTLPAARALLDRGIPFAFTTVYPGGAHEQSVVGYDDYRETLLIRDPHQRNRSELLAEKGLEAFAPSGPRGLAIVPLAEASRLDGLDLPEADLYDRHHELLCALDRHDRAQATRALAALEAAAPGHRLALQAARALALYDGNATAQRSAIEALRRLHPEDVNLTLAELGLMRDLSPRPERLDRLRAICAAKDADPLFWLEYASELSRDARTQATAEGWLRRLCRVRPNDAFGCFLQAQLHWQRNDFEPAVELHRLAACLDDKREQASQAYFRAARARGRTTEALAWLTERFEREGRRSGLPGQTLAWAHGELSQTTAAFTVLERAVELRPADVPLRLFTVEEYARWGDLARATSHLGSAQGPRPPAAWARVAARLASRRGDSAAELNHWQAVLELDPMALDAHRQLARRLAESHGRSAALEHLRQAVGRFPFCVPLRMLLIEWGHEQGYAEVESAVRDLLVIDPNDAWARRELGLALARQRRFAEAAAEFDIAARLEPRSIGLLNLRGELAELQGDTGAARRHYREALAQTVDDTWAMRGLLRSANSPAQLREDTAFIQQELARQTTLGDGIFEFASLARAHLTPEELHRLLADAHAARPDLWQTWSALAGQLGALQQHDAALALIRGACGRFPLLSRLWLDRALIHRARLEREEEIAALEKVRELSPDWGWAMRELATAHLNAGHPSEARQTLEEVTRRSPLDAVNHAALGDVRRKLGDFAGALECFRQAVLVDPGHEWSWGELDALGRRSGQPGIARTLAEELLARRPGEARSWWLLARLLDSPADRVRRFELLDRALELNPRFAAVHSLRARTLAEDGRWEEAFAACRPAAFADTPPAELAGTEAQLRAERGHLKAAIQRLREALEHDPAYEAGWRQLAQFLHEDHDDDGAIEAVEHVTRLSPHDPVPIGYLGELKLRRSDSEGAREAFRRAFELDAGYVFAGKHLVDLQLGARDFGGALETLRRLRPQLPGPSLLVLELAVAIAAQRRDEGLGIVRRLCECQEDDPSAFVQAAERLRKARWAEHVAGTASMQLQNPDANPSTGSFWVVLCGERRLHHCRTRLESLPGGTELSIRAWLAWLQQLGRHFATEAHCKDLLHPVREWQFTRLLRRRRELLHSDTRLWGGVGYALVQCSRWKLAIQWLDDWKSRQGVEDWMVNNLAISLARVGSESAFRALLEEMGRHLPEIAASTRFALWRALFALGDDLPSPARQLAAQLEPSQLEFYDRRVFDALLVWMEFGPEVKDRPLEKREREALDRFAKCHSGQPAFQSLFRHLMRRVARRTSWRWTLLWTYARTTWFQFAVVATVIAAAAAAIASKLTR